MENSPSKYLSKDRDFSWNTPMFSTKRKKRYFFLTVWSNNSIWDKKTNATSVYKTSTVLFERAHLQEYKENRSSVDLQYITLNVNSPKFAETSFEYQERMLPNRILDE